MSPAVGCLRLCWAMCTGLSFLPGGIPSPQHPHGPSSLWHSRGMTHTERWEDGQSPPGHPSPGAGRPCNGATAASSLSQNSCFRKAAENSSKTSSTPNTLSLRVYRKGIRARGPSLVEDKGCT